MAMSIDVEFGKSVKIEFAVYNRTKNELVRERGVSWAGMPRFWFSKYEDAEKLLDKALRKYYYPDDHILTIIKRTNTFEIVDTMPA